MIIEKLTIENFGNISRLEQAFHPKLTVINTCENEITAALCILLQLPTPKNTNAPKMKTKTRLCADFHTSRHRYAVSATWNKTARIVELSAKSDDNILNFDQFCRTVHRNAEFESLSFFRPEQEKYIERFCRYKDPESYYAGKTFTALTDGIGDTRTFRSALNRFLKEPNDCNVSFLPDGRAIVNNTSTETLLAVFFLLNEFWNGIEQIRNPNAERFPLLIWATAAEIGRLKNVPKPENQIILFQ